MRGAGFCLITSAIEDDGTIPSNPTLPDHVLHIHIVGPSCEPRQQEHNWCIGWQVLHST